MATNPAEVDGIVRGADGKIYAGNVKDKKGMTKQYMETYSKHIFRARTAQAEPLTGPDMAAAAAEARESGAGGDQSMGSRGLKEMVPPGFPSTCRHA